MRRSFQFVNPYCKNFSSNTFCTSYSKLLLEDSNVYYKVPLFMKEQINHNTNLFRFKLPSEEHSLGLSTGQHISLKVEVKGKVITRPYTPVSLIGDTGHFDLAIKVYKEGIMSQHVNHIDIGEEIEIRGPKGKFLYQPQKDTKRRFLMIAGGSGITPMLQIARTVLGSPKDDTKIFLIFANLAEEDILFRDEFDSYAEEKKAQFKVYYTLEKPPSNWSMGQGYVTKEMIQQQFGTISSEDRILMCGPPAMIKALTTDLDSLGISKELYFKI